MGTFRHTADSIIYINTTSMPLSFFLTLEPAYALPAGYTNRYYSQGVTHYVDNGINSLAQTYPYVNGDTYISNEATYAAAYAAYLNPTPSLATAKTTKINNMIAYAITIKNGYVSVGGDIYFSDFDTLQALTSASATYTRAGAVPVSYYLNDVTYVQNAIATLNDLNAIVDRIVALHRLCDLNIDVHRTAINALATVGAVTAYDYTTGWPTIPY